MVIEVHYHKGWGKCVEKFTKICFLVVNHQPSRESQKNFSFGQNVCDSLFAIKSFPIFKNRVLLANNSVNEKMKEFRNSSRNQWNSKQIRYL